MHMRPLHRASLSTSRHKVEKPLKTRRVSVQLVVQALLDVLFVMYSLPGSPALLLSALGLPGLLLWLGLPAGSAGWIGRS